MESAPGGATAASGGGSRRAAGPVRGQGTSFRADPRAAPRSGAGFRAAPRSALRARSRFRGHTWLPVSWSRSSGHEYGRSAPGASRALWGCDPSSLQPLPVGSPGGAPRSAAAVPLLPGFARCSGGCPRWDPVLLPLADVCGARRSNRVLQTPLYFSQEIWTAVNGNKCLNLPKRSPAWFPWLCTPKMNDGCSSD